MNILPRRIEALIRTSKVFYHNCKNIFPVRLGTGLRLHQHRKIVTTLPVLSKDGPTQTSTPPGFEDWQTVYRFNHIVMARAIQRIKLYQTGLTCCIFLPMSLASTFLQYSETDVVIYLLGASTLACVMLGVMGTLASRFIGILYVNRKDPTKLRVARLSFFGSRVDEYIPANAFLPLTDSAQNLGDTYVTLDLDSTWVENKPVQYRFLQDILPEDKYYLSLKHGTIHDWDAFVDIFGEIPTLSSKKMK